MNIKIYDTTLRDGTQGEDISLSSNEKIKIALELDKIGVDYIEGGWPGSNKTDREFFEMAKSLKLENAKISAFSMTKRKGVRVEDDPNMQELLKAETKVVTIVGKSWDLHLNKVLKISLKDNLDLIYDTIKFFKKNNKEVIFDAEHYFDGFKSNKKYVLETLKIAKKAGADCVVLCETNGGCMPDEVSKIVKETKQNVKVKLGIHCHNDSGMAIANTIAAVEAGAEHVQGTINGVGERTGNADLIPIILNLQLKKNHNCIDKTKIKDLKRLSIVVYEMMNLVPDKKQPYVGESAFAHKGGMHADAVNKDPKTYEHIEPEVVGNKRRILASDLSGKSNILSKSKEFGVELDNEMIKNIALVVKNRESRGYHYEVADASLELLMLRQGKRLKKLFKSVGFKVITEKNKNKDRNKAFVTIKVKNKNKKSSSYGNGPVDALNKALRKVIIKFYPNVSKIHLTDYKVRIIDGDKATEATTRVLIEFSNGKKTWTTIGVSGDIITASYEALVDGIEYGLVKNHL
jgi:2-isopropylmalate synthase